MRLSRRPKRDLSRKGEQGRKGKWFGGIQATQTQKEDREQSRTETLTEYLVGGIPAPWISVQHVRDEVLGARRDLGPRRGLEV